MVRLKGDDSNTKFKLHVPPTVTLPANGTPVNTLPKAEPDCDAKPSALGRRRGGPGAAPATPTASPTSVGEVDSSPATARQGRIVASSRTRGVREGGAYRNDP